MMTFIPNLAYQAHIVSLLTDFHNRMLRGRHSSGRLQFDSVGGNLLFRRKQVGYFKESF